MKSPYRFAIHYVCSRTLRAGRIIVCNDNDTDHDGIPDYADGYGLFDLPEYQASTNTLFVPIVFELPAPIDHERAKVRLTYDASDPMRVTTNSAGGHLLPDSKKLRLWTKEGGEARDGRSAVEGGDFLAAGEYSAAEFGFTNESSCVLTYYIEAVRPSEEVGDLRILFEVQPDERAGFMAADAVRLTALQMQYFGNPNGWSIFQLDPPPSDETLWNWRQNIADGRAHLADPCRTEAVDWIAEQERQQQLEEPTKPLENYIFTFNGVNFQKGTARTPIDACTIQRYNGATKRVIYWKNKTLTQPGSWEINAARRAYVDDVCGEIQ